MKSKEERQNLIKELVESNKVKTQTGLVKSLQKKGFKVTQATVSRDIKEMGLVRDSFGYKSAEEKQLEDVFRWVKEIKLSGNLAIILTNPGAAQTVALSIDKADIEGIIGSVAGDDTIFLALEQPEAKKIIKQLESLKERMSQ